MTVIKMESKSNDNSIDYQIYQLKDTESQFQFMEYDRLIKELHNQHIGKEDINSDLYEVKYCGLIDGNDMSDFDILSELYAKFNSRVLGFRTGRGHSISVSDVITLNGRAYFVDTIGFQLITNFAA